MADGDGMRSGGRPLVIGFVGSSGSGKTTLLERTIPRLEAHGLSIGVVKHASHGFTADRPGKDSYRLYGAGAHAVALISREAMAVFRRSSHPDSDLEPALESALDALPAGLDAVLVEGFAWAAIPRFILVKGREAVRREHLQGGPVLRIVRTREPAAGAAFAVPEAAVEAVERHVLRDFRRRRTQARIAGELRGLSPCPTGVMGTAAEPFDHRADSG